MRTKGRAGEIDRILGDQLRVIRIERGITQKDLAAQMNITYQQVQKYERGTTRVTVAGLIEIASILDLPTTTILDNLSGLLAQTEGSNKQNPTKPREGREPINIAGLSRADIAMLRDFTAIEDPTHKSAIRSLCRALVRHQ